VRWQNWKWHVALLLLLYITVVAVVLGIRGEPLKFWVAAVFGTLFIVVADSYRRIK
jgi:hypothetical protein